MVARTISGEGNISFVANGRQFCVAPSHERYQDILQAFRDDLDENSLVQMVELQTPLREYVNEQGLGEDQVVVEGGNVFYVSDGEREQLHGTLVDRLLSFMKSDLPIVPLINFLKKVMQNPSYAATQELYDFLEHKSLPICEDGDFLAYKAVQHNYLDKYKGIFNNAPGKTVRVKRNSVDDDRRHGCSSGLHAGTLSYVNGYGNFVKDENGVPTETSDKCVIVKINPMNVVSVPLDCECQKLRVCEYYVVKDFEGELNYQLVTDDAEEYECDLIIQELVLFPEDLEEGDCIAFIYRGETRHMEVEYVDQGRVYGILIRPEAGHGDYRSFSCDIMEDIVREA